MPAITNTPPETSALSARSASQNNSSRTQLTKNILSAGVSAGGLTPHLSTDPKYCQLNSEGSVEISEDSSCNVKSRLLTIEEYEQFEAKKKRQCLSCPTSVAIAGVALMAAVGAFTYRLFQSDSNSLAKADTSPALINKNLSSALLFPEAQAASALALSVGREGARRHKKGKHKTPCYQFEPGQENGNNVPCKKGKQGKGRKNLPDAETLPVCRGRNVVKRCQRKYDRAVENLDRLVISKNGKRCLCPPFPGNNKQNTGQSPTIPPQGHLKRGNEYRYVDDNPPSGKININTTLPTTTPAEVVSRKIFDHDCADERANLSWAQIFRSVGSTLSNPTSQAYKEGKIAYDYIIKGTGCPSQESLERAGKITAAVDYTVSTLLSLLPGTKLLTIAQNIVGPMLELIADSMEGKDFDVAKALNIDDQILFMMRSAIPTMSQSEQAALYGKLAKDVDIPKVKTNILTKRYNFHDEHAYVKVADKEYLLRKGIDNRPFVERNRFISFNQHNSRWEFVEAADDNIFSKNNLSNRDYYGISLEQLPDNARIEFNEYGFTTIRSAGKEDIKGVFLAGKFIPADWDHVAGEFVAYTHDGNYLEQRVIIFTEYGWTFEKPSVEMDSNLDLYLGSYETGIDYYPENHISAIDKESGLCRNDQGDFFIKKDYKYYEIEKVSGEADTWALTNNPYVRIKLDKGVFKLDYADNMLFGLQSDKIPGALSEKDSYYLETAAVDYLMDHGLMSESSPVRAIRPGLYVDKENKPLFILNDQKFVVSKYTDRNVYIKREQDGLSGDIALWSDHDSWVRVRDEEPPPREYQEVSSCRVARAPTDGKSCLPLVIETELHQRLQKHIDGGTTSNHYPVPGTLKPLKTYDTPAIFQDINTQKHYFLYGGKYFDAKLIDTLDDKNPTGSPIVKITGKGNFFNREKFIADIILEQKAERVEIKEVDTFIAEKLNINKDIARFYNKNRPYRYQSAMPAVEELVDEVQASGELYVALEPQEPAVAKPKPAISSQYGRVKQALFSPRIISSGEHEIEFIPLGSQPDPLDERLKLAQQHVKEKVQYLKEEMIPQVTSALNYNDPNWSDAGMYLSLLMDSSDVHFLTHAAEAWQQTLQEAASAVDPQEIYLVRAVNKLAKSARHVDADPYLSAAERYAGKALIMSEEGDNRLFINIDRLSRPETAPPNSKGDLVDHLVGDVFNKRKKNTKFFNSASVNGVYPAASDLVNEMIATIESQKLTPEQLKDLQQISRSYLEKVPAYHLHIDELLTAPKLAYLAKNDSGYRAHLLLHSPPFLTTMTEDLYCQLAQARADASRPYPWVTDYIQRRELNTLRKESAFSTVKLDMSKLAKLNTDELYFGQVAGKPGVFYTDPGLDLLYESAGNYYPVEFVGKNNRIVFIGPRDKARQVYYYNPHNGELSPIDEHSSGNNELSYNRHLDLYQSISGDTGDTSVLKYDMKTERLVPTGAKKIIPLVNNVVKVEFENFDIFYPPGAGNQVFLAAHGSRQLSLSNTRVPENSKVFFYTKKWHSLKGHMDDLIDLVTGKIASTETKESWEKLETYDITLDQDSQINYPWLALESRKTLIRVKPETEVSSKDVIDAVAKTFSDRDIEIHLYMCRGI